MKTVIDHVTVLTMDENDTLYEDGYVVFEGDKITEVGAGHYRAGSDLLVDGKMGILIPGMVNTHCHVSMIPFRTMGDDCQDRLRRFLFPLEQEAVTERLVYQAARYGICEMLLSGVTTFLDMYYFEDAVARACSELGMRGYLGETVINMATCDSPKPYGGLSYGETFLKKWQGHDLVTPIVAPHGTHTNEADLLKKAKDLAARYQTSYTLHVSEMDYELSYFREHYDKTPIEFLDSIGVLDADTIAAHCIHMTEHDLELLQKRGCKVAHCIGSNTKAGKGIAPVKEMLEHKIPVGLGTDGPSSGNTLSMFTQFRLFASFHKTINQDRSLFPAKEIVRLGTTGGANVLGAEKRIGSIEPGKKADLVLVETGSVNMFPNYNPYSTLVYSAERANVDTVFVNGKMLVEGGKLVREDLSQIRKELLSEMGKFSKKVELYKDII